MTDESENEVAGSADAVFMVFRKPATVDDCLHLSIPMSRVGIFYGYSCLLDMLLFLGLVLMELTARLPKGSLDPVQTAFPAMGRKSFCEQKHSQAKMLTHWGIISHWE